MEQSRPTQDEIVNKIDDTFNRLQSQRTAELEKFQGLQQISQKALAQEKERLIRKYGADHPRVKKIGARLWYNTQMFEGLKTAIDHSKITPPPFNGDSWRVHGILYGKDNLPLAKKTVFLTDGNGSGIEGTDYSCTDEHGYYCITVEKEQVEGLQKLRLFLTVSDEKQKIIFTSTESLVAVSGTIDYRVVNMTEDACGKPPNNSEVM
jgi:hypothetical protein